MEKKDRIERVERGSGVRQDGAFEGDAPQAGREAPEGEAPASPLAHAAARREAERADAPDVAKAAEEAAAAGAGAAPEGRDPAVFPNEGEGSRVAGRRYAAQTRAFVRGGKVEQSAREARDAVDGPEAEELAEAEQIGKKRAAGA